MYGPKDIIKEKHNPEDLKKYSYDNKNIISWYPFEKDVRILAVNVKSLAIIDFLKETTNQLTISDGNKGINKRNKYKYIIVDEIKEDEINILLVKLIGSLDDDGRIFYSFENKDGIDKVVTGVDSEEFKSREEIERVIEQNNLNATFYNVFPNKFLPEVIFMDDYLKVCNGITYVPTYLESNVVVTDERRLFQEIVKNKDVNKYANSFLVILNKKPIKENIEYVKYNRYRKRQCNLITYYKNGKYYKKPNFKEATSFLNRIIQNHKDLEEMAVPIINVTNRNDKIYSRYQPGVLFSEIIRKEVRNEKKKLEGYLETYWRECKNYYKEFIEIPNNNVFSKFNIQIDSEKHKKLHYVKNLYLDMIPQNVIIEKERYWFFDQEWKMERAPFEFLLYRAIKNTLLEIEIKDYSIRKCMRKFGLEDFYEEFEKLDQAFLGSLSNKWSVFYGNCMAIETHDFMNCAMEAEREKYQKEISTLQKTIDDITESTSWKITKPIRTIMGRIKKS